uniref:Protein phosphatase 1, regulatory subunit 32 n=1 Tax=Cyprinus carpio TaxID=7962 RepID=A0A8C2F094_CYPCA
MVGPLGAVKPSVGTARPLGRPSNISLDQYCTSYRQSYGKELFQPCLGHHFGTGYSANHRPVLYYSSSLDRYDNPQFGLSLLDSFESQSKRHYQHLVLPDGTEPLACSGSRSRESGYLQLQAQPRHVRAKDTHIETQQVSRAPCHVTSPWPHCAFTFSVSPSLRAQRPVRLNIKALTFLTASEFWDDARRKQESVMRTDFLPGCFLQ